MVEKQTPALHATRARHRGWGEEKRGANFCKARLARARRSSLDARICPLTLSSTRAACNGSATPHPSCGRPGATGRSLRIGGVIGHSLVRLSYLSITHNCNVRSAQLAELVPVV